MIYLDNAATSYPKPAEVVAAVQRWFVDVGVSAERGDGRRCTAAAQEVGFARSALGALLGWPADRIAFVSGATEGMNLVLRAVLGPGDVVLTTAYEHSSVVRPLRTLQQERGLQVHVIPPAPDGTISAATFADWTATHRPRLCVFTHASNVTGAVLDAAAFAATAHRAGAMSLLDASQSAGHLELRVGADVVVASAHKGLLAPPGLGFVALRPGLTLRSQKQGGTGSSTALDQHPAHWPQAFEAGTPNTAALFGLAAALRWSALHGRTAAQSALERCLQLEQGLQRLPAIRLLLPPHGPRLPVLSFLHAHYDPAEIGAVLDQHGIHVRSGHHCAPWLHEHLGTTVSGTVRMSPGATTTAADIEQTLAILATL